jgi:hypothetical protein
VASIPAFDRRFFRSPELCTRLGDGELGGKARGLLAVRESLAGILREREGQLAISIPRMIVVATSVFDAFVERNGLGALARSGAPDGVIADAFQRAAFPAEWVGDLRALVEEVRAPLAVRSSSLLEDAMHRPFAGVYVTKMIPNDQPEVDLRFRRLTEAIKLVYASTYFGTARRYLEGTAAPASEERMAVLIQEVVGRRHGDRFYPDLSGVGKSYNFYPSGKARPDEGVIHLALGLGKTIVDGGACWAYSPRHPAAPPPYATAGELLDISQRRFWAVRMGPPPAFDPTAEDEHLVEGTLADAEYDGTLALVASTYDAASDRLSPGLGRAGPRLVDFAPLLRHRALPLNEALAALLERCREAVGGAVEIEFALSAGDGPARLGFLQARPMVVSEEVVEIGDAAWAAPDTVVASTRALGNGVVGTLRDVVYVRPECFEARHTPRIAEELREIGQTLRAAGRPYLLIGFGRWGSSDPWLGIPVEWGDIAGARVIVESTLPGMDVEASQGAHFFHNLASFQVAYLTVRHDAVPGIDWSWLASLPATAETSFVRHVALARPLRVKVDGRVGRGAVWRPEPEGGRA